MSAGERQEKAMADDWKVGRIFGSKRIDVSRIGELRRWSDELKITQQQLLSAVLKAGDAPAKVKEYLAKSKT